MSYIKKNICMLLHFIYLFGINSEYCVNPYENNN